jgi:hypothetical protein
MAVLVRLRAASGIVRPVEHRRVALLAGSRGLIVARAEKSPEPAHDASPTRPSLQSCVPAHSSSGLGRRPLTAVARVRIPYAPLQLAAEPETPREVSNHLHCLPLVERPQVNRGIDRGVVRSTSRQRSRLAEFTSWPEIGEHREAQELLLVGTRREHALHVLGRHDDHACVLGALPTETRAVHGAVDRQTSRRRHGSTGSGELPTVVRRDLAHSHIGARAFRLADELEQVSLVAATRARCAAAAREFTDLEVDSAAKSHLDLLFVSSFSSSSHCCQMPAAIIARIGVSLWRSAKAGITTVVVKLLGGLLLLAAAVAGVVGIGWLLLDAIGTEWDYCPGGSDCIAGWKIGAGFAVAALVAGVLGLSVLRRKRDASGSRDRLA